MKRKTGIILIVLFTIVILIGAFLNHRMITFVQVEAGSLYKAEDFARYSFDKERIHFVDDTLQGKVLSNTDGETIGEVVNVKVALWPLTKYVEYRVVDTIPPTASPVLVTKKAGQEVEAEEFVTDVQDATSVTIAFLKLPDTQKVGEQEVTILVTDSAGHVLQVLSTLEILNVKESVVIEAGSPVPDASAFLIQNGTALYAQEVDEIDTSHVGVHEMDLVVDDISVSANLVIEDTIEPEIEVHSLSGYTGAKIEPMEFVQNITDATEVTACYKTEVDFSKEGEHTANIIFKDEGGNRVEKTVSFSLKKDTIAPKVAVSEIEVELGENISYKKAVNYSDNADSRDELTLEIDNSLVDINTIGTYNVTYTVTDQSNNSTTVTGAVSVYEKLPEYYDEELVNQKADRILAEILEDNMTKEEQVKAIYTWIRRNVGYVNHSEKGDWVRGAYEGLFLKQGDCYVYACTTKVLLTRAGIPNMDIIKKTVNPSHYWNLVDVGDGWYHLDTTPRKDKSVFFMVTDEELMAYSNAHKNSHAYDASLYPKIN